MNKKKVGIGIAAGVGTVVLIAGIAVAVISGKINNRMEAFRTGFSFQAKYQITVPENVDEKTAASYMASANMLSGTLTGETDGEITHLELAPEENDNLVLEIYQKDEQLLINVEKIYEMQKDSIREKQPLLGSLLPEWKAGAYISTKQIEEITGYSINITTIQQSDAELTWMAFEQIEYDRGDAKKSYYRIRGMEEENYDIIVGIDKSSVFQNPLDVSLILDQKDGDFEIKLDMLATPEKNTALMMPADVMEESDISNIKAIWEAFQSVKELLEELK